MTLAWKCTVGVGLVAVLAGAWATAGTQRRARLDHDLLEVTQRRDTAAVRSLLISGASPEIRSEYDATPLHHAEAAADIETVTILVEHGADVNARDRSGRTALQRASIRGDLAMVRALLALGADPQAADHTGRTALISAAAAGHPRVVRVLLRAGAASQPLDLRGLGALHLAAGNRHPAVVELLLRHGADPRPRSRKGTTPVLAALRRHSGLSPFHRYLQVRTESVPEAAFGRDGRPGLGAIIRALARHGADLRSRTREGYSALDLGLGQLDAATLDELKQRGASGSPTTDLLLAVWLNRPAAARTALKAGASPHGLTPWGESALWVAACLRRHALAEILLRHGAHPDYGRYGWSTPLSVAATLGDTPMVRLLLRHGARVNSRQPVPGEPNQTPLLAAIHRRHPEVVHALLAAGADVNQSDWSGHTPLQAAAALGDPGIVRLLLDGGALVNAGTTGGDSALTRACLHGHLEVAQLLLQRGADPTIRNDQDYTLMEQLDTRRGRAAPSGARVQRILPLLRSAIKRWPGASEVAARP